MKLSSRARSVLMNVRGDLGRLLPPTYVGVAMTLFCQILNGYDSAQSSSRVDVTLSRFSVLFAIFVFFYHDILKH